MKNIRLDFTVLDKDIGNDDKLGHLSIGGEYNEGTSLLHWNKVNTSPYHESEMWHSFNQTNIAKQPSIDPEQELGDPEILSAELLISLCYEKNAKKLHVKVFKARNLPKFDKFGLSGLYHFFYFF